MSDVLQTWRRKRVTTYLARENYLDLQKLSGETGIPMGRLVDQALDKLLMDLHLRDTPATAPVSEEHLTEAGKRAGMGTQSGDDEE